MLYGEKSREQLNEYMEELLRKKWTRNSRRELYDNIYKKFNIPFGIVEKMIMIKRNIREFSSFEIFAVLYFLDRNALSKFFTEDEINNLSSAKLESDEITFPITFRPMVQITPDQWIGKTTLKQIMELKNSGFINYAENEQRAMKIIKHGRSGDIILTPWVNKKSVREIAQAMKTGNYIPDPITLNIPDGSEFEFDGDELIVNSLTKGMFNLDDGYHRYLAMSLLYDEDESFDYPMELRIIGFSNAKANLFIYQQNKKNPMKSISSDVMDPNSISNMIIQRINQDPGCNIHGMIGHNGEAINDGILNKLISFFFVHDVRDDNKMQFVISLKNDLVRKFNCLTEQDQIYLSRYSNEMLVVIMFVFASDIREDAYAETVSSLYKKLSEEDLKYLKITNAGRVRQKGINILKAALGGGGENV